MANKCLFIFAKKLTKCKRKCSNFFHESFRSLETLWFVFFSVSLKAQEKFESVEEEISDPYYEIRDIVVGSKILNNQISTFNFF